MKPSKDPSIHNEPHLKGAFGSRGDNVADEPAAIHAPAPKFSPTVDAHVDYTVWDEPALGDLAGAPAKGELTYKNWLDAKVAAWTQGKAWSATLIVGTLSGLWALVAVFFGGGYSLAGGQTNGIFNFIMICAFAPLAQEICKVAVPLWVVEKRPYYFTGWFQIFFCSLISAIIFTACYNLVSMFFYPAKSDFGLIFFWSGYLLMHVFCSTLAATGLERIWHSTLSSRKPPRMDLGYPWFMAAFLVHAAFATGLFAYRVFGGEL